MPLTSRTATQPGRARRFWPPLWLRILLALPLLGMLAVRVGDAAGDAGIQNVNTFLLGVLFVLILAPWFVFFSAYPRWLRLGAPLAVVAGLAVFFGLYEFRGVSGSMIPRFVRRGTVTTVTERPLPRPPAGGVDLATTTPDDWPGFLGPERSGRMESLSIDPDWDRRPPQKVWSRPVGAGWSAFAVVNGVAVTMEQHGGEQWVSARDAGTGALLWAHVLPDRFEHPLGGVGPRSTPTIAGGRVYALDPYGRLVCLEGRDGSLVWKRNLLEDYGMTPRLEVEQVQYGRSNSPLVTDGLVVVPVGGNPEVRRAGLAAFAADTGETVWEGPPRQLSFSSPRRATLAGVDQILIVNEDTLSGHRPDDGALLWEHPWPGFTAGPASVSQAVPVPPDRVFVSKGYGGGAALLQLSPAAAGGLEAAEIWANPRVLRTKFTQVVIHEGHVYGLSDGILECVDLETGERVWKRGRYGHGQILGVGDYLLVLAENGVLALLEMTPDEAARERGRFQALEGQTWNNLALSGDLLLVRNGREAAAWRLPLRD